MVIAIFVNGAYHKYTLGYNFSIPTTPQKISVSELVVIFGAHPCFWPFFGLCRIIGIRTFNFGPLGHQKMTQNDNGPGLGWNYGETSFFFVRPKSSFLDKNGFLTQKIQSWERHLFSLNNVFRSCPEHGKN